MATLQLRLAHLKLLSEIWRHFKSPWLIVLLRLGIIRIPYFPYRLTVGQKPLTMLARPTTTSMADLFVLREVFVNEAYKDVLPLLNGRKNIRLLDIGANLGSFTIWMDRILGVREAFCFEPEPDSFRLLEFNLRMNGCSAARCIESAVGGEARTIRIALKKDSPGGTNIYHASDSSTVEGTPVPVVAFDQWLREVEGDFDVLKIDCEGAEWEIFRRADAACFKRFRVLLGEVHDDPERKQPVSEFKGLAEKLGFRTVRWDNKSQGLYFGVRDA
jgi:FkbM family methyltransferase